jgi:hypothetical protein
LVPTQFGRSAIVGEVNVRITEAFARNLERRLNGNFSDGDTTGVAPFGGGSLNLADELGPD